MAINQVKFIDYPPPLFLQNGIYVNQYKLFMLSLIFSGKKKKNWEKGSDV
jgi:hypothetical protein